MEVHLNFTLIVFWVHFWELVVLFRGVAVEVGVCAGLFFFQSSGWYYFQSAGRFYFQGEAKGLSVPGGGSSLGAGPTVGVVAEGRYIAVSTVIIVVVDSKTTEYLHVSCSNLIFLVLVILKLCYLHEYGTSCTVGWASHSQNVYLK